MVSLLRYTAVLAGTAAAVAVGVTPAGASPAGETAVQYHWECPSDALACLWDGANGSGDRFVVRYTGTYDLPAGYKDKVTSFRCISATKIVLWNWNAGTRRFDAVFWDGYGCQGNLPAAANNVADRITVEKYY